MYNQYWTGAFLMGALKVYYVRQMAFNVEAKRYMCNVQMLQLYVFL